MSNSIQQSSINSSNNVVNNVSSDPSLSSINNSNSTVVKKVSSLNLNKSFKPVSKPVSSGVLVLGRGGKSVRSGGNRSLTVNAPKPVNLPSLKKESHGFDPAVQLIPTGQAGNLLI